MSGTSSDLLTAARELAPVIAEHSSEIDQERRLPTPLARQLKQAGFFRMLLGEEFGGLGCDPVTACRVVETISQANASAGWVVMILAATGYWASSLLPDDAAGEIFLAGTEVSLAGTLVPSGKAVKADGGWRLTGQWPFASGCLHADWMGTGSFQYDGDQPVRNDDGSPALRLFITPVSDCHILDTWDTTGLRGTGSHDYTMTDVFVPDRMMIPHPLQATPVRDGARYAYPAVAVPMMAAVSLGTGQAALDGLTDLLGAKLDRRSGRPVSEDPDKQAALGAVEGLVGSARAYLYATFEEVWAVLSRGDQLTSSLRGRFRIANSNAVASALQAVDRVYAAAGATSIYKNSALERCFRDVHTAAAHAFMRPATLADGGKLLLGLEPGLRIF